jgi:copper(I)-binding protein
MLKPVLALAFAAAMAATPAFSQAVSSDAPANATEHAHQDDHEDDHDHDDEHGHDDHDDHAAGAGDLTITHPWARATAAGGTTMVFLEVVNEGETDTLEGAQAAIAEAITIVGFSMVDGRQSYEEVGPVEIDRGAFDFDPFGLALELSGLQQALNQGDRFPLVLDFANAGPVEVMVEVEAANATEHSHAGHSH